MFTIDVYDTNQARRWLRGKSSSALKPERTLEVRNATHIDHDMLRFLQWHGPNLLFASVDRGGNKTINRWDVAADKVELLATDADAFTIDDFVTAGDASIYMRTRLTTRDPMPYPSVAIQVVDGRPRLGPSKGVSFEIVMSVKGRPAWVITSFALGGYRLRAWIAPDRRSAVIYGRAQGSGQAGYHLLDFETRSIRRLASLPKRLTDASGARAIWLDNDNVILFGADTLSGANRAESAPNAASGKLNLRTNTWEPVSAGIVQPDQSDRHRNEGQLPNGLKVNIVHNLNEPPRVVVQEGRSRKTVSHPDPSLAGVWRAKVEPLEFEMADGRKITGLISFPRNAQRPVPLVIQIEDVANLSYGFAPDGFSGIAYARQLLNARGMAVLSLAGFGDTFGKKFMTEEQGPELVARLDAAVKLLASRGQVDPEKVGLVGFSHAGWLAHFAATFPQATQFRAVEVFDSVTFSFLQYFSVYHFNGGVTSHLINGGRFWEDKQRWMSRDVIFNIDKLRVPILFVEAGKGAGRTPAEFNEFDQPSQLQKLNALASARRPFEMLMIPEGGHSPEQPRQRQASLEATADWMAFWLADEEDKSPSKLEQYVRWRKIRNDWAKQQEWEAQGHSPGSVPGVPECKLVYKSSQGVSC